MRTVAVKFDDGKHCDGCMCTRIRLATAGKNDHLKYEYETYCSILVSALK